MRKIELSRLVNILCLLDIVGAVTEANALVCGGGFKAGIGSLSSWLAKLARRPIDACQAERRAATAIGMATLASDL